MGKSPESDFIYLFDRATGALRHRISGLPNVINHLAYAAHGRHLVPVLSGPNGLRVYETNTYREVEHHPAVTTQVPALAWAARHPVHRRASPGVASVSTRGLPREGIELTGRRGGAWTSCSWKWPTIPTSTIGGGG